jgi:hypothetical protein
MHHEQLRGTKFGLLMHRPPLRYRFSGLISQRGRQIRNRDPDRAWVAGGIAKPLCDAEIATRAKP